MNPVTNPAMSFMPQNIFHNVLFSSDRNSTQNVEMTSTDITAIVVAGVIILIAFAITAYITRKD